MSLTQFLILVSKWELSGFDVVPNHCRIETVLVIEYGKIEGTVGYFDPPEDGRGASRLVISSPPVSSVNNRAATVILGMTVGGGSAVNGQVLDRGSKYDYNEWARLGSPQFDGSADIWDWDHFGPSFEKVSLSDQAMDAYTRLG